MVTTKHNPLVHMSSFKTTQRGLTRSPIDFREGRRASDGLVAQQVAEGGTNNVVAFNSQKLSENCKTKGVLDMHLVQRLVNNNMNNNYYSLRFSDGYHVPCKCLIFSSYQGSPKTAIQISSQRTSGRIQPKAETAYSVPTTSCQ